MLKEVRWSTAGCTQAYRQRVGAHSLNKRIDNGQNLPYILKRYGEQPKNRTE